MTDIRRLRKLAGLNETVADDPLTNDRIERAIAGRSAEDKVAVLDALEVIKNAGDAGLTAREWAEQVRTIHGDPDMPLGELLKSVVRDFAFLLRRNADGRHVWLRSSDNDPDVPPDVRAAVDGQVGLTYEALAIMRAMGSFTARTLGHELSRRTGIPTAMSMPFADHLITQFQSMLMPAGTHAFRMRPEETGDRDQTMSLLRDLARRAGDHKPDA